MLATLNDVLPRARRGGYAVGLFNAVNLELARGVIAAAESLGSPIIMGTAEVLLPFGPLDDLAPLLVDMARRASVPVVVHFDHGLSIDSCARAIKLGFTSVMLDASSRPYAENVRESAEIASFAHAHGATVEAELGHVGNAEDSAEGEAGESSDRPEDWYTNPEQALDFVRATGVDALAIAVGTLHGTYRVEPRLDFERLSRIASLTELPLVLHGGSGLSDAAFRDAITRGISKINVFTDINLAAAAACEKALQAGKKGMTELIPFMVSAVEAAVAEKLSVFGSIGKA